MGSMYHFSWPVQVERKWFIELEFEWILSVQWLVLIESELSNNKFFTAFLTCQLKVLATIFKKIVKFRLVYYFLHSLHFCAPVLFLINSSLKMMSFYSDINMTLNIQSKTCFIPAGGQSTKDKSVNINACPLTTSPCFPKSGLINGGMSIARYRNAEIFANSSLPG